MLICILQKLILLLCCEQKCDGIRNNFLNTETTEYTKDTEFL